jgi:hypothetical protein
MPMYSFLDAADQLMLCTMECLSFRGSKPLQRERGYPALAFEVNTAYDRQLLGVSAVQFGTRMISTSSKLMKTSR